jgi:dihydrofolate reductase
MLTLVAAVAENGVIGAGNRLPWRLPADLRHFKAVTMGHSMLMGRRTWQSIGRALPGRRNLVLTRDAGFAAPGVERVESLEAAVAAVGEATELMIIGGAQLYALALPRAGRIHLTRVHAAVSGNTRFPPCDWSEWREVGRQALPADADNAFAMTFLTLERC